MSSPLKGVYNPKAVVLHAALLDQACAHCPRFLAAATRRCLGRVAVPVWLAVLTDQRPVIGLVGRYPTSGLMGRAPVPAHPKTFLRACARSVCGIRGGFPPVFPTPGLVTHVFLSRSPRLGRSPGVRLACIRHAASVDPEPGSNSSSGGWSASTHRARSSRPRITRQLVRCASNGDKKSREGYSPRYGFAICHGLPPQR